MTAMEFLTIKNEKLYRILYMAESAHYSNFLPTVNDNIIKIENNTGHITNRTIPNPGNPRSNQTQESSIG